MTRTQFIQHIIDRIEAKSYLEIGVQYGYNFTEIECPLKVGVDPKRYEGYEGDLKEMTSDEFFEENRQQFDVIFIDGLHHADQVIKDVENALECISEKGVIVLHDCSPRNKEEQEIPERHLPSWTGNVWRAFLNFRRFRELTTMCFDICTGMGVIYVKTVLSTLDLTFNEIMDMEYEDFDTNRVRLLNLKTVDDVPKFLAEL